MAVIYKARKASIANKEGKKLYHPMIVLTGSVKLEQIANDLAELSSLSPGDTYNVVKNLPGVIQRYLANGNSVFLDGLGSFAPALNNSGNGVETPEEVTANGARLKITFRPSARWSKRWFKARFKISTMKRLISAPCRGSIMPAVPLSFSTASIM